MDMHRFVATVRKHAGSSEEVAERAARKTLETLGELLVRRDRHAMARRLPDALRDPLFARSNTGSFDLETFYKKVTVEEGANQGFQIEHAQAVCMAIAEALDAETAQRIRTRLPDRIAELLTPREIPSVDPSRHHDIDKKGRKLSSGRPGTSRPLHESSSVFNYRKL